MDFASARARMVELLVRRGITDPAVLAAFRKVPRESFIDPDLREFAYADRPLPIAEEQTISQPYIVALMAQTLGLQASDRVLEVGTGSGYAAAILAELAGQVYTIERYPSLAQVAAERLNRLGYKNVQVFMGDGTLGLERDAPFDKIVVAAGGPDVPEHLKQQLRLGGQLLMPVGSLREQKLVLVTRTGDTSFIRKDLGGVRVVPLVGDEGWEDGRGISDSTAPLGATTI